jgi:hypothetical protein
MMGILLNLLLSSNPFLGLDPRITSLFGHLGTQSYGLPQLSFPDSRISGKKNVMIFYSFRGSCLTNPKGFFPQASPQRFLEKISILR